MPVGSIPAPVRSARISASPFARRAAGRRIFQRPQSTTGLPSQSSAGSHIAAGVAGGGVVLLGGYTWYHFSGVKTLVSASTSAQAYYEQTKRAVSENAPKSPNEVLAFLRSTAKSYSGLVPGASAYVDSTFDALDELHETHGEETSRILQKGYDEVKKILTEHNNSFDVETGMQVVAVLRRCMGELQEVGEKAGQDAFELVGKKYPQVTEKLGGGYAELKEMAEKRGPEAKKILDEATQQVKSMFSKGFSQDALSEAQKLIQSKSTQIRKLAESSGMESGSVQKGWDVLQEWIKTLPEGEEALKKIPDLGALIKVSQEKGDDAKKLTRETHEEIMKVLERNAKKAKELAKETGQKAKEKA